MTINFSISKDIDIKQLEELYNDVIKKVAESVRLMKKSTWNSYDEMNKLLIEKVREVK